MISEYVFLNKVESGMDVIKLLCSALHESYQLYYLIEID